MSRRHGTDPKTSMGAVMASAGVVAAATFGEVLCVQIDRLRRANTSLKNVSDECGVPVGTIKDWMSGRSQPTFAEFKSLRRAVRGIAPYANLLRDNGAEPDSHDGADQRSETEVPMNARATQPNFQTFGSALRWLREREKLSRPDLAEFLSVHPTAIAWWEDGSAAPIKVHLDRLVEVLPDLRSAPNPASRDIPKPGGTGAMSSEQIDALRASQMDELTRRLLATIDAQAAKAKLDLAERDAKLEGVIAAHSLAQATIKDLEAQLAQPKVGAVENKPSEPARPPLRVVPSNEAPSRPVVPPEVVAARSPVVRVARLSTIAANGPRADVWVLLLRSAEEARMTIPEVLDAVGA